MHGNKVTESLKIVIYEVTQIADLSIVHRVNTEF